MVRIWIVSRKYFKLLDKLWNCAVSKLVTVNNANIAEIKMLMECINSTGVLDRSGILPAEVYHLAGNGNIGESLRILTQWLR